MADSSSRLRPELCCASTSTPGGCVKEPDQPRTACIGARDVEAQITELAAVWAQRAIRAHTPLNAQAWQHFLDETGLLDHPRYASLPFDIQHGFRIGIPQIHHDFHPPNSRSAEEGDSAAILDAEIEKEIQTGRVIKVSGPALCAVLGPNKVMEKVGKPGHYRPLRNCSFPHSPRNGVYSINSQLSVDAHPCSWGTFWTTAIIIASLPPGSKAAVRDVCEAFRSVPIHPDEWAGLVFRIGKMGDDSFGVDTALPYGPGPGPGVYGRVADAFLDILRARGLGPLLKWVDDMFFIRLRQKFLEAYNRWRSHIQDLIAKKGGIRHTRARITWVSRELPDGRPNEFAENFEFPVRNLNASAPRPKHENQFAYGLSDIDEVAQPLSIIFAPEKDIDFTSSAPFTGLQWDLANKTVGLPEKKREKYERALTLFLSEACSGRKIVLSEVQSIYGKLLHACTVVPEGRAWLTKLEKMLRGFSASDNSIFCKHTVSAALPDELQWWTNLLKGPVTPRPLPVPIRVLQPDAYSDASSGVGIGIVIGDRWRAWQFKRGWREGGKDIQWAEAVVFELLIITLLNGGLQEHAFVWGDNSAVVEGWKNFRSRNVHVNRIFRRIHQHLRLRGTGAVIHARYIPSAHNPADGPSRGKYGDRRNLLPRVPLTEELARFLVDCDSSDVGGTIPLREAAAKPQDNSRAAAAEAEEADDGDRAVAAAILQSVDAGWEDAT